MRVERLRDLRVLVVTSDQRFQDVLICQLKLLGILRIVAAINPDEFKELMGAGDIDFIIFDHSPPVVDGIQFTYFIRHELEAPLRKVPVILLTQQCDQEILEKARAAGINELVLKPLDFGNLLKHVRVALDVPRDFIVEGHFIGPDRRRGRRKPHRGDERRSRGSSAAA